MKNYVLAILAALVALGILSSSALADVVVPREYTVTVVEKEHKEAHIQGRSFIRFRVGVFTKAEGLSKEEVENAEECRWIGEGTDVPSWTNSEGVPGQPGFRTWVTHERAYACKINGQWFKKICGNYIWLEVKPNTPEIPTLLVRSYAKKKIRIHIPIPFVLQASCGSIRAKVKIDQWVSLKAFARSKGKAKYVKVSIKGKILDKVKGMIHGGITCEHIKEVTEKETPGGPPPNTPEEPEGPSTCSKKPEQEKCLPKVFLEEEINDMEASTEGHHHKRYVCFSAYPGAESTSSDLEVKLKVRYGNVLSKYAEYKGGDEYCAWYETGSEEVTEEMWGWARDKKTGAEGESARIFFPVNAPTPF